ncbi:DMT family transporter [Leifsonia sp. Leaf336]|uniref:DMT family transporter n=1 Tax=Leifsonia sp. Leaf336 TaxID=1736341 RepID=UPI0009E9502C|nr:DMT family transporter [Leifsonia sp. Leaf336]
MTSATIARIRIVTAGLLVVVLWASAFPAIRVAAPALGPFGLALARTAIACVAFLAAAPFAGVRLPARRDLPLIAACGVVGMAAYQVLLTAGELTVPAGTASLIVAAAPLVSVAIAAGAFGERLTTLKLVGSGVALGGVAIVSVARSGLTLSGAVWLVLAAMVVQGIYHPLTKPLLRRYSGLEVATYAMVAGLIPLLAALPWSLPQLASASPEAWLGAAYLGLLPSAAGFVLWGYAVARLSMATATALLYLVSPVAVGIAAIWLGEIPQPAELLGGGVVIAGVALIGLSPGRPRTPYPRRSRRRGGSAATARPTRDDPAPVHAPNRAR